MSCNVVGASGSSSTFPVAGPAGSNITITGWLDQYYLDIWLDVMHLARNEKPGETVTFSLRSMLKRLHSTVNTGSADLKWIHDRLKYRQRSIAFDDGRHVGVAGSLIGSFRIETAARPLIRTNPELRALWESITHLDIEQRRSLGQNQLAKAMHAMLASHVTWMPTGSIRCWRASVRSTPVYAPSRQRWKR